MSTGAEAAAVAAVAGEIDARERQQRVRGAQLRLTLLVGALAVAVVGACLAFLLFVAGRLAGALDLPGLGRRMTVALLVAGAPLLVGAALALVRLARPAAARARDRMRAVHDRQLLWRMRVKLRPPHPALASGEIAAATFAGDEAARGYYDIVVGAAPPDGAGGGGADARGCWIAAGDIEGVTLEAALVFLTVQSAFNALAQYRSDLTPDDVLRVLGQVLDENVRHRLRAAESVCLAVCHLQPDGRFFHASTTPSAGVRIWRAADGAFLDAAGDGAGERLLPGDLLVLHSESLVGASSVAGEAYGAARLGAELGRLRDRPLPVICREIEAAVARWVAPAPPPGTLVIARHAPHGHA